MKKAQIWLSDLTHTAQGISAATFPLGASYVLSYAKQELGSEFDFKMFKFPSHLDEALRRQFPAVLCFSNYSWNLELAYKFASLAKGCDSNIVTVFGGPNFPTTPDEKLAFFLKYPDIDFYVELEGELGFVDLMKKLASHNLNGSALKDSGEGVLNTSYMHVGKLVNGPLERIRDINVIPSPYLTGAMDEYFDMPLAPMIETTRGCPFSCTFCADGLAIKSKVFRYDSERTKEELHYIAERVKHTHELRITDLNFAMYKEDRVTALAIAELQKTYNYPTLLFATAGKNKPQRTIEIASIIDGWTLGASIQSTDPEVLTAIKRSNISSSAYQEVIEFGNSDINRKTYSEIILGLPGDTKEKHYESLRFGVSNNVNSLWAFQSMMLVGTEMANQPTRKEYGLITKFRTIPGCLGTYEILGNMHSVAEIEEIIVGSDTLSKEEYVECRVMDLIVSTFHNNAVFEEIFSMVRAVGASPFDCLIYIKDHPELYPSRVKQIIDEFAIETNEDLFDTHEEANTYVLTPEIIDKYIGGELGTNELLLHRALMFKALEDTCDLLFSSVKGSLAQQGLLTPKIEDYLVDLKRFTIMRKKDPFDNTEAVMDAAFNYDFEAIRDADFLVDPNSIPRTDSPIEFHFFLDEQQKKYISNQVTIYATTPTGLGKMMLRSNLKLVFRSFARSFSVNQVVSQTG